MGDKKKVKLLPSETEVLSARGYVILKKLGEGSYAKVYLAKFCTNNKDQDLVNLACKVIDLNKAGKDFVVKFLPRELDIIMKLKHPHIIEVHSVLFRKSKYFIFLRQAELGDLLDFVDKGKVTEDQARLWMWQIALALQYMHEMNIVHRDLKCENILVTSNYNAKLSDFGFGRYSVDGQGVPVLSDTYCGSISYAAPEILRAIPYDPKLADSWSYAVVVYVLLNKATPFKETNVKELYYEQINRRWTFKTRADKLSQPCKNFITKLLEPELDKRLTFNKIIGDAWFAMDPVVTALTTEEKDALDKAKKIGKRKLKDGKGGRSSADIIRKKTASAKSAKNSGQAIETIVLKSAKPRDRNSILAHVFQNAKKKKPDASQQQVKKNN